MEDVAKTADKVLVLNHSHVAMFGTVPEVYSRTDELEEMGLTVPQITKYSERCTTGALMSLRPCSR